MSFSTEHEMCARIGRVARSKNTEYRMQYRMGNGENLKFSTLKRCCLQNAHHDINVRTVFSCPFQTHKMFIFISRFSQQNLTHAYYLLTIVCNILLDKILLLYRF